MVSFQNEKAYLMEYFTAIEQASSTSLAQVQASFMANDYEFHGE